VLLETERLNDGVVGYAFLDVEAAQSEAEAVTVTVVIPEWGVGEAPWEVETLCGLRLLFVPDATPDDVAVSDVALAEVVMEWLPTERLDAVPEEPVEDAIEVGPVLTVAEDDGKGAEESQFKTSKATVPLIVMK
jgi:hypothetical protein